jgi:hypothetical protein
MKRANRITAPDVVAPRGLSATPVPHRRPVEELFAGPRPASMRRGLEPAFLLFDRELLDRLHGAAAALGVRYDALAQRIARDHIEEY